MRKPSNHVPLTSHLLMTYLCHREQNVYNNIPKPKRSYLWYLSLGFPVIIGIFFSILMIGCTQPQVITQTEYIKVPTYCKVTLPKKPKLTQSSFSSIVNYQTFLSNLKSLLVYTDELEMALYCCTDDPLCISKSQVLLDSNLGDLVYLYHT